MNALSLATVLGLVVVTVGCGDDTSSGGISFRRRQRQRRRRGERDGERRRGADRRRIRNGRLWRARRRGYRDRSHRWGRGGVGVRIQGGYQFTEGTAWMPALGVLRFSDIPASQILELDPGTGTIGVWRSPSSNTNGNALAPNGDLMMCEHSGRRVSRSPAAVALPAPTDVATSYQGMQLNSPNDAVVASRRDGVLHQPRPMASGTAPQGIPFQGVFRVGLDDLVTLVDDSFAQPNGIALSPDEGTLYVTDSQGGGLFRYDVAADGSAGPGLAPFGQRDVGRHGRR